MSVNRITAAQMIAGIALVVFLSAGEAATITVETVINDFSILLDGQLIRHVTDDDQIKIENVVEGYHVLTFKDASPEPFFEDMITNVTLEKDGASTVFFFPELGERKEPVGMVTIQTKVPDVKLLVDNALRQIIRNPGEVIVPLYNKGMVKISLQDREGYYSKLEKNLHVSSGNKFDITYAPENKVPASVDTGAVRKEPESSRGQIIIYQIDKFK